MQGRGYRFEPGTLHCRRGHPGGAGIKASPFHRTSGDLNNYRAHTTDPIPAISDIGGGNGWCQPPRSLWRTGAFGAIGAIGATDLITPETVQTPPRSARYQAICSRPPKPQTTVANCPTIAARRSGSPRVSCTIAWSRCWISHRPEMRVMSRRIPKNEVKFDLNTTVDPLPVRARVVWAKPVRFRQHEVGLNFLQPSPELDTLIRCCSRVDGKGGLNPA